MSFAGKGALPYSCYRGGRKVVTLPRHSDRVLAVFCGQFLANVVVACQPAVG
jgi:hypothetical protein